MKKFFLAILTFLLLMGSQAAIADPGDVGSVKPVAHYGAYICYKSGTACDFVSQEVRITVPGDHGPHTIMHFNFRVHFTLKLPIRSQFHMFAQTSSSLPLYDIYAFGELNNAASGHLGTIWHHCPQMGEDHFFNPEPERFTTDACSSVDSHYVHHSAEIFFRFTIFDLAGYFWQCHVWSPVARWFGSKKVGRHGHYEFINANLVAGWNHPPPDRSIANAGKDHVHCDRFPNVGVPSP